MLIGSLNEDNIIGHVKGFIACHDPCLTVIDSHDYGLIGFNDKWIVPESQLTSIDQIYRVEEKLEADEPGGLIQIRRFFIGCEAKTNTTGATEAAAIVYMNVHLGGKAYDKISIKSDADAALLKMCIPDCSHWVQVLHHAATTQLLDMFYVIASTKRIIQLVHITYFASVLAIVWSLFKESTCIGFIPKTMVQQAMFLPSRTMVMQQVIVLWTSSWLFGEL